MAVGDEAVCQRCGWIWTVRVEHPRKCPNEKCQSYDWEKPHPDVVPE